jgi:3-oxoacyl-[acyl-carrier-protein] synthase II
MKVILGQSDAVTAYGWGFDALWAGLLSGMTAIRPTERFAQRRFVSNQAAEVPGLEIGDAASRTMAMLEKLLSPLKGKIDPNTVVMLATTVGEIEYVEKAVIGGHKDANGGGQALLARIKKFLGLCGTGMVVSSACASSTAALARAAGMIRHGQAKKVLVVACDSVSEFVYSGFSGLLSLCDGPARPFDARRCGLTLGEAAAWVILSSDAQDGEAEILGWGNTTDAVHMTAPDRGGAGLSRAIDKACAMAGRSADEVGFVAAHGTATLYSDAMELTAFRHTFGRPKPIFSVKGGLGHTLGAAGLVQILVAARAMTAGIVPPTVGFSVAEEGAAGWASDQAIKIMPGQLALSTNSGFGGVNTAILLGGRGRS